MAFPLCRLTCLALAALVLALRPAAAQAPADTALVRQIAEAAPVEHVLDMGIEGARKGAALMARPNLELPAVPFSDADYAEARRRLRGALRAGRPTALDSVHAFLASGVLQRAASLERRNAESLHITVLTLQVAQRPDEPLWSRLPIADSALTVRLVQSQDLAAYLEAAQGQMERVVARLSESDTLRKTLDAAGLPADQMFQQMQMQMLASTGAVEAAVTSPEAVWQQRLALGALSEDGLEAMVTFQESPAGRFYQSAVQSATGPLAGEGLAEWTEAFYLRMFAPSAPSESPPVPPDSLVYLAAPVPAVPDDGFEALAHAVATTDAARAAPAEGVIYVMAVVHADGTASDVTVADAPSEALAAEAQRIVGAARFSPAHVGATPVRTRVVVPVPLGVSWPDGLPPVNAAPGGGAPASPAGAVPADGIYDRPDIRPVLLGGLDNLLRELRRPTVAAETEVATTVYVTLVVDEQGRVLDARAERAPPPELAAEAVRVVRQARFSPALHRGAPVRARLQLPIRFDPR